MPDQLAARAPGTVYGFAVSPDFERDGLCFAASSSGLYRSEDGGQTWQSAYDALSLTTAVLTTAVAVSPDFSIDRSLFAAVRVMFYAQLIAGARGTYRPFPHRLRRSQRS